MSKFSPEIVEAVSRALCLAWGYNPNTLDDIGTYSHEAMWKDGRTSANVSLTAILPFLTPAGRAALSSNGGE